MCADDSSGCEGVWTQEQGQGVVAMTLSMGLKHHLNTDKQRHRRKPHMYQLGSIKPPIKSTKRDDPESDFWTGCSENHLQILLGKTGDSSIVNNVVLQTYFTCTESSMTSSLPYLNIHWVIYRSLTLSHIWDHSHRSASIICAVAFAFLNSPCGLRRHILSLILSRWVCICCYELINKSQNYVIFPGE